MPKNIHEVGLTAYPSQVVRSFDILREAGSRSLGETAFIAFALFGGAPRDADYAAYYGMESRVNDYDLRVWLPEDYHEERVADFVTNLGDVAHAEIRPTPSAGTGRIRYCLDVNGMEMDVSIRPGVAYSVAEVAISRAWDADIGLSSVAIAPDGTAWAADEYLGDRNDHTLSVYPDSSPGASRRLSEYTEKMKGKFSDHEVVWLGDK